MLELTPALKAVKTFLIYTKQLMNSDPLCNDVCDLNDILSDTKIYNHT